MRIEEQLYLFGYFPLDLLIPKIHILYHVAIKLMHSRVIHNINIVPIFVRTYHILAQVDIINLLQQRREITKLWIGGLLEDNLGVLLFELLVAVVVGEEEGVGLVEGYHVEEGDYCRREFCGFVQDYQQIFDRVG